jgi:CDP-4-dehydro-6-deoxyglucose reductase
MSNTHLYICQTQIAKTSDITLLSLTPLSQGLRYKAGQYVEILLRSGDCLLLSIANAPTPDGRIDFHLRHDSSHPLAQVLLAELENAPTVALRGPFGVSTLDQTSTTEEMLIFLAGGTGFAPIKALLEIALTQSRSKLLLYWGIKRPEDAYDLPLLQLWKNHHPHFEYTLVLSEPTSTVWDAPTGFVHDYVAKMHTDMTELRLFASGPYEMIKAAQQLFGNNGLSEQRFISDMTARN